jgi:hypothetical protein
MIPTDDSRELNVVSSSIDMWVLCISLREVWGGDLDADQSALLCGLAGWTGARVQHSARLCSSHCCAW